MRNLILLIVAIVALIAVTIIGVALGDTYLIGHLFCIGIGAVGAVALMVIILTIRTGIFYLRKCLRARSRLRK